MKLDLFLKGRFVANRIFTIVAEVVFNENIFN